MDDLKGILFPHEKIREIQDQLIIDVDDAIRAKKDIIIHAPTGLGKTAATLSPALRHAIDNDLTIFFLTSRHTQHKIVIETLKLIKDKYKIKIPCVDIVGKKWMCPMPGVDKLYSNEFSEFCKSQREDRKCEFYVNVRDKSNKFSVKAKKIIEDIERISPLDSKSIVERCSEDRLCPYEITIGLGKNAKVVIGDYYYVFNKTIMENFFNRIDKKLEDSIVIIDEGHNLPERIRELLTGRLTGNMLRRAIKEAKKAGYKETISHLQIINDALLSISSGLRKDEERIVSKQAFMSLISKKADYDELIADLDFIAESIRSTQKQSYIGGIALFLEQWEGDDQGFIRIISMQDTLKGSAAQLSYRCLDPSMVSKDIIEKSYSTILMSGTLNPTNMYKNILGFPADTTEKSYNSPFPVKNKLSLIIPRTTTKFTARNERQYNNIAKICAEVVNLVPGNSAIFFPSYYLRDSVNKYFKTLCLKTIFEENSLLTKTEKDTMLERFKKYKNSGAVLLGASSGSFGEGIDLPGDLLKCVVIVGLPLQKPNLETKELISYYDLKFGRGWDYGYLFPAFNKSLQNAGRCIRSKKDKGVIIYLDERYAWPNYFKCFPKDTGIRNSNLYADRIKEFFE